MNVADLTLASLLDLAEERGVSLRSPSACWREAPDAWREVLDHCDYVPVDYTPAFATYQACYMRGAVEAYVPLDLTCFQESTPVAVWPLALIRQDGGWRFGTQAGPVLPPLFRREAGARHQKQILKQGLAFLQIVGERLGITGLVTEQPFTPLPGAGQWHWMFMQAGASASVTHDLMVDLEPDLATIRAGFRKSFKALISQGLKLWRVERLDAANPGSLAEFRELHIKAAGRVTRAMDTWQAQEAAIRAGAAFALTLRAPEGPLAGAGLFHLSAHEGLYAVAAYDRSRFDLPLGHVLQFKGIEEMKRLGLRWHRVGRRCFPGETPAASAKELSISLFKEGLATHLMPRLKAFLPLAGSGGPDIHASHR